MQYPGKNAKKPLFRPKNRKKTAFSTVFDLIKRHFDGILDESNGGSGVWYARGAVCCMPDFPDAASLPARPLFRLMLKRKPAGADSAFRAGRIRRTGDLAVPKPAEPYSAEPAAVAETNKSGGMRRFL